MVDLDGIHPVFVVGLALCGAAGLLHIFCVLPCVALRRKSKGSANQVLPVDSSPDVSGASVYEAGSHKVDAGSIVNGAPADAADAKHFNGHGLRWTAAEIQPACYAEEAGGSRSSGGGNRPPKDVKAHKAPMCPDCNAALAWSDFAKGDYTRGWKCNYASSCGSHASNTGGFRWFCEKCSNDFCTKCKPYQVNFSLPDCLGEVEADALDESDPRYWAKLQSMTLMMALADAGGILCGPAPPPESLRFFPQVPRDSLPQLPVLSIDDAIAETTKLEAIQKQKLEPIDDQPAANATISPSTQTDIGTYDGSFDHEKTEEHLRVTFSPGRIGVKPDWNSGWVKEIQPEGQAHRRGVSIGMRILKVDGHDYSKELLREKISGQLDYEVVFADAGDLEDVRPPESPMPPPTSSIPIPPPPHIPSPLYPTVDLN